MKKWGFLLVVFAMIGYIVYQDQTAADADIVSLSIQGEPARLEQATAPENPLQVRVTKEHIYNGSLLLVNRDHPVHAASRVQESIRLANHRERAGGFVLLDPDIRLSPVLLDKFTTMVEAAAEDGVVHFMISSGYRDESEQSELYEKMGPDYALPAGFSEHNLGLALDIGSTQGKMEHAEEGKWLERNAWKYGFILRYPKHKTDVTGIQNEPWHFRYVGLPHSAIMQEKNFVLEEYLDYLKRKKSVQATIDRQTYRVTYFPITGQTTIPVPADRRYELSGDNIGGVILTEHPGSREGASD